MLGWQWGGELKWRGCVLLRVVRKVERTLIIPVAQRRSSVMGPNNNGGSKEEWYRRGRPFQMVRERKRKAAMHIVQHISETCSRCWSVECNMRFEYPALVCAWKWVGLDASFWDDSAVKPSYRVYKYPATFRFKVLQRFFGDTIYGYIIIYCTFILNYSCAQNTCYPTFVVIFEIILQTNLSRK